MDLFLILKQSKLYLKYILTDITSDLQGKFLPNCFCFLWKLKTNKTVHNFYSADGTEKHLSFELK